MKKLVLLLTIMMLSIGSAMALPIDKYTINRSELPQEAQNTLTKYFPNAKIGMIKIDKHWLKKPDYKVRFTDGSTIEFNSKGKWKEIEMKGNKAVPDGMVMKTIQRYLSKNYPDSYVRKIDKDSKGYELELSDGIELKFDLLGTLKKVKMED